MHLGCLVDAIMKADAMLRHILDATLNRISRRVSGVGRMVRSDDFPIKRSVTKIGQALISKSYLLRECSNIRRSAGLNAGGERARCVKEGHRLSGLGCQKSKVGRDPTDQKMAINCHFYPLGPFRSTVCQPCPEITMPSCIACPPSTNIEAG